MNSKSIYLASRRLIDKMEWEVNDDGNEWLYVGLGEAFEIDEIQRYITAFFKENSVYFVISRKNSMEINTALAARSVRDKLEKTSLVICEKDFSKLMEFNQIGVMRKGNRKNLGLDSNIAEKASLAASEYRNLTSSPDVFSASILEETQNCLNTIESPAAQIVAKASLTAIERPALHTAGPGADHFRVKLSLEEVSEITSELLTAEALAVDPNGETTPGASYCASLVDVWGNYQHWLEQGADKET